MRERDVAFGKLAISRGLVTREAVSDCFRATGTGTRSLREELVARGLLSHLDARALENSLGGGSGSLPAAAPPVAAAPASSPASSPASPPDGLPRPGDLVGPYRIAALLGRGGMGAVFRARHEATGAEVALKLVLDPEPRFLARFQRELDAIAKLRHPAIVGIHASGVHGPKRLPYAVLDLVPGTDLAKRLESGPLEPARALEVVAKVARAVQHAHERGVLHRDLKPANVLLRAPEDEPVLSDFGLARDEAEERLTKTGEVLGTAASMAPEQAEGRVREHDARTDVYGLGAILYEALAGRPPFEADSPVRLLKKVLFDDPVDPARLVPGVPADAGVVALRCLAKEPGHRYASALEVAQELERVAAGEPILARRVGRLEAFRRRARRRPRFYAAGAFTVLVVAATPLAIAVERVKAQQALAKKALDDLHADSAGLLAKLSAIGYPAVAVDPAAVTSLDDGFAAVASHESALASALTPEMDADARTARRWRDLLRGAPSAKATSERAIDRVLEAAAALRALSEKTGSADVLRERLAALPENGDRRILEGLRGVVTARSGSECAALVQLCKEAGVTLDRAGNLMARPALAPWAPAIRSSWVHVLARAFDGERVGDVIGLVPYFQAITHDGGKEAPPLVPGLRAALAGEVARRSGNAYLNAFAGARTAADLDHVVDFVRAVDERPKDALVDSLMQIVEREVNSDRSTNAGMTDELRNGARALWKIRELTDSPPPAVVTHFFGATTTLLAQPDLPPKDRNELLALLLGFGMTSTATQFSTIQELGSIPRDLTVDHPHDLAAWTWGILAIRGAAELETKNVPEGVATPEDYFRQKHAAYVRARKYLADNESFVRQAEQQLERAGDRPLARRLRAIERFSWVDLLFRNNLVIADVDGSHPNELDAGALREAIRVATEARGDHPNAVEVELGLGRLEFELAGNLHSAGDDAGARAALERALEHDDLAWKAQRAGEARVKELQARTEAGDRAAEFELTAGDASGFGTTNGGLRVRPFWARAGVDRQLSEWAAEPEKTRCRRAAIAELEAGLAIYDDNRDAHHELAALLEVEGRLDEALAHAEKSIPGPHEAFTKDQEKQKEFFRLRDRLRAAVASRESK